MLSNSKIFVFFLLALQSSNITNAFIFPIASKRTNSQRTLTRNPSDSQKRFMFENDTDEEQNTLLSSSSGLLSTILFPVAKVLNEATGGYALTYADCSPESEKTLLGQAFLATNLAYMVMGLACWRSGDAFLGSISELASVASFTYHYNQLANPKDASLVRLVLTIDYLIALPCVGTGILYLSMDPTSYSPEAFIMSGLALFFLGLSWVWEAGMPYCINHGLWHLFGAYAGFLVCQAHSAHESLI
jgi:hypothetical protein